MRPLSQLAVLPFCVCYVGFQMVAGWAWAVEQFTGKVVGITAGDTLSVLREGKTVQVRLHGIEAPMQGQGFSLQARQFTRDLVFHQLVSVMVVHASDREGRLVADVFFLDGRSLNQALVRAGYAWWSRHYVPKDAGLARLEAEARQARRGLWTDVNPVPPWEWRQQKQASGGSEAPAGARPRVVTAGTVIGNQNNKIYHWPGCPDYGKVSAQHRVLFSTREAAVGAGYRPASNCR